MSVYTNDLLVYDENPHFSLSELKSLETQQLLKYTYFDLFARHQCILCTEII